MNLQLDGHARSAVKDSIQKATDDDPESTPDICEELFLHKDALLKLVEEEYEQDEWNPLEYASETDYCLNHLKIITVKEFIGSKNEMQLLGFLLAKAVALEQFIVFDFLWREEWDLDKVFASVPRASPHLQMRLSQWDNLDDKLYKRIFA